MKKLRKNFSAYLKARPHIAHLSGSAILIAGLGAVLALFYFSEGLTLGIKILSGAIVGAVFFISLCFLAHPDKDAPALGGARGMRQRRR